MKQHPLDGSSRRDIRIGKSPLDGIPVETDTETGPTVAFVPLDDVALEAVDGDELRAAYRQLRDHHRSLVKSRLADLKAEGKRYSGEELYGFVRIDGELVPHDEEQKVIRIIRELAADPKRSYRAIARKLTKLGLRTRTRSPFEHVQVRRILERAVEVPIPRIGTDQPSVPPKSST